MEDMIILMRCQFPITRFCEKRRWASDYKQAPRHATNLLPGLHHRITLE